MNPGDLACVEEAASDPRIVDATSVPDRFTPEAGLAFLNRQHERRTSGLGVSLAVADHATDEACGLVILQVRPASAYWIIPSARRHDLARRAVSLVTTWGLGAFARIEAWVEPDNEASQRVLTASGFQREGLLRSFLVLGARRADMLVYSRIATAISGHRGEREWLMAVRPSRADPSGTRLLIAYDH